MAASQKMAETADQLVDAVTSIDPWAAPLTHLAALIGVLWISLKIFSFWRMIASLLILPGTSVRHKPLLFSVIQPIC